LFQGRSRLTVCAQWCIYDTLCCDVYLTSRGFMSVSVPRAPGILPTIMSWTGVSMHNTMPCQYNMGHQNLRSTIAVGYLLTTPSISIHSSYDPVTCSGFTDDDLTTQVVDPVSLEHQSGGIVHSVLTAWRHP